MRNRLRQEVLLSCRRNDKKISITAYIYEYTDNPRKKERHSYAL